MFRLFGKDTKKITPEVIHRGKNAEQLLNSNVYLEATVDVENKIWEQFFATPADDKDSREVLYTHIVALKNVQDTLACYVAEAQVQEYNTNLFAIKK